jgi:glycosidase
MLTAMTPRSPTFEFHISRAARDRYGFADGLFSLTGNVVTADLRASRDLARRINVARDTERHPERAVSAGGLNAMGLIDEVLHLVLALYRAQRDPRAMLEALTWLEARLGRVALDETLRRFADEFPVVDVYRGREDAAKWLARSTGGVPHRAIALEELITVWLANANPAFAPFLELFGDTTLATGSAYRQLTGALREYFETRPRFGPEDQNLIDMLRAPALASPDSLEGQLAYIREAWKDLLGDFLRRLLTAVDVLKEEEIAMWLRFHPPVQPTGEEPALGPSGAEGILRYAHADVDVEAFSADEEWMPRTVLIAKTVYVWLDQLSRAYGRAITRLDDIPDEELEILARRGFNALWLIGLWERSRASQRIKQLGGNPDAVASAYSLHDYVIAAELGGEAAYANLRDRARARGIRLASDMVPNHMGIDSRWVIEHPDWFLSRPDSPYPSYGFDGPDLGHDGRVEIKIEDHYYDRSDAAVVFRRLDRFTGDARFIYHGNDGTSFPWNDTAQLDYLKPEVREGLIQTILHVARQFPIIRFDAAMTLAKRHFQRLWYPEPGTGGAVPSRAEHGMTKADFDAAMPVEFWREVVDRVAVEAPGTLLLAEAFWLMEGYFVRTLGMHRVYNSAFMNMLRDEQNANYRSVIKNTLEFDPEVLKRYVNFMNNPDERTAVDQFGTGDKYFGVAVVMSTLPGLPMFGHGQVEGFTEKYGMEYRRAYFDERPEAGLVARHEREIAPLLHRRALFAEARHFRLYDFYTDDGWVNEDVFAYSNRRGDSAALVVYHNRFASTQGWVRLSCAYAEKTPDGGRELRQQSLGDALHLSTEPATYVAYRDSLSGLEFIQSADDLARGGMHLRLDAYTCRAFVDWRHVRDDVDRPWGALARRLDGRGVPSLDEAMHEMELEPVHGALRALLDPCVVTAVATATRADEVAAALETAAPRVASFLEEARSFLQHRGGAGTRPADSRADAVSASVSNFETRLRAALRMDTVAQEFASPWPAEAGAVLPWTDTEDTSKSVPTPHDEAERLPRTAGRWGTVLAWCAVEAMARVVDPADPLPVGARLFDTLRLRRPLADAFHALGVEGEGHWRASARVRVSFAQAQRMPTQPATAAGVPGLRLDPDVAWLIGLHDAGGTVYYVKEPFEQLLWWLALPALLDLAAAPVDRDGARALERSIGVRASSAAQAGYRLE